MSNSQNWVDEFLVDLDPTRWSAPDGFPASMTPAGMFAQDVPNGLEVVLVSAASRPSVSDLRRAWEKRRAKRASPVLLVVGYPSGGGTQVALCGPVGDQASVYQELEVARIERLAALALAEPTHHAATRFLLATLPELDSEMPGLRNVGLLATQELRVGVPSRGDWEASCAAAVPLLRSRGKDLVEGLGFAVDTLATNTSMLTIGGSRRVVAVFLDEGESFDAPAKRFGTTPVSHALAVADQQNAPWVVITRGSEIRLYAARPDTGVGRKGRAETFVEANLSLLPEDRAGYLHLLFSASALALDGTIEEILDRSADFAADLAVRLRERVYFDTVPTLARAVADRMSDDPDEDDLAHAYEQVMVILFRLLFLSYAEDKDLLPYRTNSRYADHSLSRMVRRLVDDRRAGKEEYDPDASDLWEDVTQLWRAVDKGRSSWGVPAYNGGLFSVDPDVSASGAAIDELELSDAEFGPALAAMLIDDGPEGIGPVDFRSLSVREFGTIYEGLLESQLSVAPSDLTVDAGGNYVPAKKRDDVLVDAGQVYFHNRSGARKATGSYFTKPFAVEHLLDHALEPGLTAHLGRLATLRGMGDDAALAEAFFDFRCADIAMGSAHFLVAAVDRIEARLSNWLAVNPVPAVSAELDRLRRAAYDALGDLGDGVEIETGSLIRRQVARRCVYGVDRNPISVELARLAIWIHTFVPGLPLSFLDHNLVCGDSLTGVGTLDEVVDLLEPGAKGGATSLFRGQIEEFLGAASKSLVRLARTADSSATEIADARQAHLEARAAVAPAVDLFDIVTAHRAGGAAIPVNLDADALDRHRRGIDEELITSLRPIHFPAVFPEVFLRPAGGFDCLLGNPPWEKLHVEEHAFWGLRFPGLRSMPVGRMNAEINRLRASRPDLVNELDETIRITDATRRLLSEGNFPDLGASHPDLYKAFAWRYWWLAGVDGHIGIVLPRAALSGTGMATWRRKLLDAADLVNVALLVNRQGWVFEGVHPQWTTALISVCKSSKPDEEIPMHGPFQTLDAYRSGMNDEPIILTASGIRSWTSGAAFPLLPSADAGSTFLKLRNSPRFDGNPSFAFRPVQGDLNATTGKKHMVLEPNTADSLWPVDSGGSFSYWSPDFGEPYAWISPATAEAVLSDRRSKSVRRAATAFIGHAARDLDDPATLPCRAPRIAFRDVARSTDTRTVICCLLPPNVLVSHKAPYLLRQVGDEADEAFLLGVMSSMIFDWQARRWIENSVSFDLLSSFTIPDPGVDRAMAQRVAMIAGRLAAIDDRYEHWAKLVGVPCSSVRSDSEKQELVEQLDAAVALLYGLDESDLEVIYSTFHEGKDYSARHAAVLDHYRRLR